MSATTLKEGVQTALAALDAKNDDHWTENGLPRLDALAGIKLTRAELTAIAPLFTRTSLMIEAPTLNLSPENEGNPLLPVLASHEDLDELQARVDEAQAEVLKAEAFKTEAQREVLIAQANRDKLIYALEKARPAHAHENIMGIRAVLDRSQSERAARGEVAKELRAAGITAALLTSGSKLDQAMARKRGFGLNRPNLTPGAGGAK